MVFLDSDLRRVSAARPTRAPGAQAPQPRRGYRQKPDATGALVSQAPDTYINKALKVVGSFYIFNIELIFQITILVPMGTTEQYSL